jgi:hypothetical protein
MTINCFFGYAVQFSLHLIQLQPLEQPLGLDYIKNDCNDIVAFAAFVVTMSLERHSGTNGARILSDLLLLLRCLHPQ